MIAAKWQGTGVKPGVKGTEPGEEPSPPFNFCPGCSMTQVSPVMHDQGLFEWWWGQQLGAWLSDHLRFHLYVELESINK